MNPNESKDKFKILVYIKEFIIDLENIIQVMPKKDMFTRNMIYQDALDILELVNKANYEKRIDIKKNYQIEALAKINKIDFYLERAYKLEYLSEKQIRKASKRLDQLNRMIYAWCNNEK